jgi:hypothetical protein
LYRHDFLDGYGHIPVLAISIDRAFGAETDRFNKYGGSWMVVSRSERCICYTSIAFERDVWRTIVKHI